LVVGRGRCLIALLPGTVAAFLLASHSPCSQGRYRQPAGNEGDAGGHEIQVAEGVSDLATCAPVQAVSELLKRPAFRNDPKLSGQLGESTVSIMSNSAEGFGQDTDRAFARYLVIARGSNNEAISQLTVALARGYLTENEFAELEKISDEMGKSMTSLIAYLRREDRKYRG
jgi:four helix bundle protein